eukprot:477862-Pleurochrysis_carterae.AAC.1
MQWLVSLHIAALAVEVELVAKTSSTASCGVTSNAEAITAASALYACVAQEHVGMAIALHVPLFVVVTKVRARRLLDASSHASSHASSWAAASVSTCAPHS